MMKALQEKKALIIKGYNLNLSGKLQMDAVPEFPHQEELNELLNS
jgi:hypothetical protein